MPQKHRLIIDTDPGCDDVLAILLALAVSTEELEVLLVSVTFGNIDVRSCLRNVVSIFHILEKELEWRKSRGRPASYEGLTKVKPLVAIGASAPLQDKLTENADYFHGSDGLGGISISRPDLSPLESWKKLFETPPPDSEISRTASKHADLASALPEPFSFTASRLPAHKEILNLLRANEPDEVTIVALGPLTNCALAAAEDPETFLRCRELITMGGAVDMPGNITPVAEFNVFADAYAAARVYALSSPSPASTMPLPPSEDLKNLPPYPPKLTRTLNLTLMSLDITEHHVLTRAQFESRAEPLLNLGSPLADWTMGFMTPMFDKMETLHHGSAALALHDPLCVWYALTYSDTRWKGSPEDIRIEISGQWTKGMTLLDRRDRKRRNSDGEVPHDRGNWLGRKSGNRVRRMLESPGREAFAPYLLDRIFGQKL